MGRLLVTVRCIENQRYLGVIQKGYIIQSWLRTYKILNKWPSVLTTLIVNNIVIQTNPKLVYHDPQLVVLAQDDAKYEAISVENVRGKRNRIRINDYVVGQYPIIEKNIVLISNPMYKHDSEPDRGYLHVNYCTLWPDKDYEYDQGGKDRDRVIYTNDIFKN